MGNHKNRKYDHLADEIFELYEEKRNWRDVAREMIKKHEICADTDPKPLGLTFRRLYDRLKHKRLKEEVTTPHNIPFGEVTHYWDKTKNISAFVKVRPEDQIHLEERIESIVERFVNKTKPFKIYKNDSERALIGTVTDEHIGMNPDPNGKGLFNYEYNAKIYSEKLEEYFNSLVQQRDIFGTFEVLYLDNLGDRQDGWNGFTTRGGHELEQNMTNEEVFEVCVESKLRLIENCINEGIAKKYVLVDVSNDNHSGNFGLLVNLTISKILNKVYSDEIVSTKILKKFMEVVKYGNHTFIKTHGKDEKYMKRGLPFNLNDKAIRFINEYISHYGLTGFIHLDKGDLHRIGFEKYKLFDYRNFMSFAPPSNWIGHNFGDGYSGYTLRVVNKWEDEIIETSKFLNYKKLV